MQTLFFIQYSLQKRSEKIGAKTASIKILKRSLILLENKKVIPIFVDNKGFRSELWPGLFLYIIEY